MKVSLHHPLVNTIRGVLPARVRAWLRPLKSVLTQGASGVPPSAELAAAGPRISIALAEAGSFCGLSAEDRKRLLDAYGIREDLLFGMLKQAFETGRGVVGFYAELASTLMNCAAPEEARRFYERIVGWGNDALAHTLYLQCLNLSPGQTNESLLAAHREWAQRYEPTHALDRVPARDRDPERRLKVGYICSFFSNTVSRLGYNDLMRRHDRSDVEVFAYNDGADVPNDIRDCADHWRNTRSLSDADLAELIDADGIDILTELNGHCAGNRLRAIALRPAPVQIAGSNHICTMGMRSFDYVISDVVSIPPEDDPYFVEKVYRNPVCIFATAYRATDFPAVVPPPCDRNGFVTFGYFGAIHKVNRLAIRLWSDVLKEVPASRFLLKAAALDHALFRSNLVRRFSEQGIGADRLILRGYSPYEKMLEEYADVDVMLDSHPHTGGSTMIEALWQGVVPITLKGDRWAARTAAGYLCSAGLSELITTSEAGFVAKAVEFGRNAELVRHYRMSLRETLGQSRLTDVDAFCRDMESAYRTMWRDWCALAASRAPSDQVKPREDHA